MNCIVTGKDLMETLAQCEDERRMWKQHCEHLDKRIKTYQKGIKGLTQRILNLEKENKKLRRQIKRKR